MGDWTDKHERSGELAKRWASAAILIPFALLIVWTGGWRLGLGCGVFAGIMAWEWANMSGHRFGLAIAMMLAVAISTIGLHWPEITSVVLAAVMTFSAITAKGSLTDRAVAVLGVLYVSALSSGIYFVREGDWDGRSAALYFMSFVWASDAAAFFTGRTFGGPRLLPSESPNKTWSGAIGALLACTLCGIAASRIENASTIGWIVAGLCISVVAQLGDLFESGLKRRFHVKDSSGLLPGHGGVLDRVDGLGAVMAVASLTFWATPGLAKQLGL
jgi:phosphatidate cytidylyltransferase